MTTTTITQAAHILGVAEITIRRRIRKGIIQASKSDQGTWTVELPPQEPSPSDTGHIEVLQQALDKAYAELEAKNQQIEELHRLLAMTQRALPDPNRPWWKRLLGLSVP